MSTKSKTPPALDTTSDTTATEPEILANPTPPTHLLASIDIAPRSPTRESDPDYSDFREVTVKLGAPDEANYVDIGAVVSGINAVSGELTFRVAKGSRSFGSVRAREVLRGS